MTDTTCIVTLTELQRRALLDLVGDATIKGSDAPLVTGILRALAEAQQEPRMTFRQNADVDMFEGIADPALPREPSETV